MSTIYYLILWFAYLLLVLMGLIGAWRISRSWPYWLKSLGRLSLIVLFFTPAPQAANSIWMAPAIVSLLFDQLQSAQQGWFRAGVYLLITGSFALLIYIGLLIKHWLIQRRRRRN